jgi:hypothetical protein
MSGHGSISLSAAEVNANPTKNRLVLVLSEHSVASDWVKDEVMTAFAEERDRRSMVVFPIRIDDAVMSSTKAWAAKIRESRHIGDFRHWNDRKSYVDSVTRLLRDLKR